MLVFLALGQYSSSFESLISITNFSALRAPAARQRPVIGFNQMSPRQDYSFNAGRLKKANSVVVNSSRLLEVLEIIRYFRNCYEFYKMLEFKKGPGATHPALRALYQ